MEIKYSGMGKAISEGVVRGVVCIDKTVIAIQQAVAEAEEMSGINNIRVVNVFAGQHVLKAVFIMVASFRHSSNEEITVEDINRLTNECIS